MDAFVTADKVRRNFYVDENTSLRSAAHRSLERQGLSHFERVYRKSQLH